MKTSRTVGINITSTYLSNIEDIGLFVFSLLLYIIHKIDKVIWLMHFLTISNIQFVLSIKVFAVSKLIWSRGKISWAFQYLFIFLLILSTYILGGVFQQKIISPKTTPKGSYLTSVNAFLLSETRLDTDYQAMLLDSPIDHTVKEGETLAMVGKKYGLSVETIKFANNMTSDTLVVGQTIKIPRVEGTIHTVVRGDTIASISRRYKVSEQTILDFNYIDEPYILEEGQLVTIPNAEAPKNERLYVGREEYDTSAYGIIPVAKSGPSGTGAFMWPLSGVLTQYFGMYHPGLDIAAPIGTNIFTADKGVVVRAGWWQGGYGNAVQVDHRNGYISTYAHMSEIKVSVGDEVKKGQLIGLVGSTGRSTGPHTHFTIQFEGKYLNPLTLLK